MIDAVFGPVPVLGRAGRTRLACLLSAIAPIAAHAQPRFELARIATPAQSDAIPLYPAGTIPPAITPERWGMLSGQLDVNTRVEGRIVRNVSQPTITPVLPAPGTATGAAVIIAPGGAFLFLSVDTEGYDIARKLAEQGIAAFILKYRTNPVPDDDPAFMRTVGEVMSKASQPGTLLPYLTPWPAPMHFRHCASSANVGSNGTSIQRALA